MPHNEFALRVLLRIGLSAFIYFSPKMIELSLLSACVMILSVLDRNQILESGLQRFRHLSREILSL